MRQLSALDAAFLGVDTPSTPMHTMAILLLDSGAPRVCLDTIQALIVDRMPRLPSLGQRMLTLPLELGRPVLVDDPEFDVRNHVLQGVTRSPLTLEELDRAAGDIASRPLDHRRPLWEAWFFDRVEGGGSAIVFKLHHAIIDGVSAALFMAQLLDTQPTEPMSGPDPAGRRVRRIPSRGALLAHGLRSQAAQPLQVARRALGVAAGAREWWAARSPSQTPPSRPWPLLRAPQTELDGAISAERQIVRGSVPLEDFRCIKKAFGTTVNNVLLAACTIALRRYLEANGSLPSRPMVASVPISTRDDDSELGGNRVSSMLVRLPVQLECPAEIVRRVQQEVEDARRGHDVLMSKLIECALEALYLPALRWLAHQHERLGLANLHPPVSNVVISNIVGPPIPLYCAGVHVRAAYPFGPLLNGAGLNLTVLSYQGRMDLGLIACPSRTPDAERLMTELQNAVASLRATAESLSVETVRTRPTTTEPVSRLASERGRAGREPASAMRVVRRRAENHSRAADDVSSHEELGGEAASKARTIKRPA